MPQEYISGRFMSRYSGSVRQSPPQSANRGPWVGWAWCGAAPTGLKDACGAAGRSFGSLTPGPLRPLPSGTAVRPMACPPQRPPHPHDTNDYETEAEVDRFRTATGTHAVRSVGVVRVLPGGRGWWSR